MKRSLGLRLCRFMDSEKLSGAPELMSELNEAIDELDADDEAEESSLWQRFRPFCAGALLGIVFLWGGIIADMGLQFEETPHYKMPTPITIDELNDNRVVGVTAPHTSITIEWDNPKIFSAKALGELRDSGGYTVYDKYKFPWPLSFITWGAHCVIHLPAGSKVEGRPYDPSSGMWSDPSDGVVLAHEILHCLRGDWHWEQPGLLDQAEGKEMRKP